MTRRRTDARRAPAAPFSRPPAGVRRVLPTAGPDEEAKEGAGGGIFSWVSLSMGHTNCARVTYPCALTACRICEEMNAHHTPATIPQSHGQLQLPSSSPLESGPKIPTWRDLIGVSSREALLIGGNGRLRRRTGAGR